MHMLCLTWKETKDVAELQFLKRQQSKLGLPEWKLYIGWPFPIYVGLADKVSEGILWPNLLNCLILLWKGLSFG